MVKIAYEWSFKYSQKSHAIFSQKVSLSMYTGINTTILSQLYYILSST